MRNLTLNDPTQQEIIRHLIVTERLLAEVATKLSGSGQSAEIIAMPDLGFPSNVMRAWGGFYTGAFYSWSTLVPFVPVDSTVNCCGVSAFRLHGEIPSKEAFDNNLLRAQKACDEAEYIWNFANGNHFVIYGKVTGSTVLADGNYLLLHSSASEYKKQAHGLYPTEGNWYWNDIATHTDPETQRVLRYISGSSAEKFATTAKMLEGYNQARHRFVAEQIAGPNGIAEEVLNVQHYGMPTANSVAIGCQWHTDPALYTLLTAPNQPVYFVSPGRGAGNDIVRDGAELLLTPHGMGMQALESPTIEYLASGLAINNQSYKFGTPLKGQVAMKLRGAVHADKLPEAAANILAICPGTISATLQQIYSYYNPTGE
jgi:hypothetical protein